MKVKVVGFTMIDFKTKDGEQVQGTNVFYNYENMNDTNLFGMASAKVWIGARASRTMDFEELVNAEYCDADFNGQGKIMSLSARI